MYFNSNRTHSYSKRKKEEEIILLKKDDRILDKKDEVEKKDNDEDESFLRGLCNQYGIEISNRGLNILSYLMTIIVFSRLLESSFLNLICS